MSLKYEPSSEPLHNSEGHVRVTGGASYISIGVSKSSYWARPIYIQNRHPVGGRGFTIERNEESFD